MSWIDELNFERALDEVINNQRAGNDFIIDPLRFEDLKIKKIRDIFIITLAESLKKGTYHPQEILTIDYPKSNFILRPCARPLIEDLVIFQAVTNYILSKVHKKISKNISYSFNKIKDVFSKKQKRKIDHWLDFEERTADLCSKYEFLLITDIASFFEHISHTVLKDRLLFFNSTHDYTKAVNYLIDHLLANWTQSEDVKQFSLPQGPDASRYLADIYLYPVDKKMKANSKIVWFRYMDDIRIFAHNKHDLKLAMIDLVAALRKLKLNLNAKKTNIFSTDDKDSLQKVIDPNKKLLSLIDRAFKSRIRGEINLVKDSLLQLYDLAGNGNNPFSERHMNFFISHYIDLMKFDMAPKNELRDLVYELSELLEDKPHMTTKLCRFLLAAAKTRPVIARLILRRLIQFITDKKKNLYAWQELIIMDSLRQIITPDDKKEIKLIRKLHPKSKLALCQKKLILGKGGNNDDLEEVARQVKQDSFNYEEQRTLGLAMQRLNNSIKKKIYMANIRKQYVKEYLNTVRGNRYYGYTFELPKENIESDEEAAYP